MIRIALDRMSKKVRVTAIDDYTGLPKTLAEADHISMQECVRMYGLSAFHEYVTDALTEDAVLELLK